MANKNTILPQSNNDDAAKAALLVALLHNDDDDLQHTDDAISDFETDATEGLQQLPTTAIPNIVAQLNIGLDKQLKKKKRLRKPLPSQTTVIVTIVTVLILVVLAYVVIKKLM